jgi:hypothetical protein
MNFESKFTVEFFQLVQNITENFQIKMKAPKNQSAKAPKRHKMKYDF